MSSHPISIHSGVNGAITQNLAGTGAYTLAEVDGGCAGSLTLTNGLSFGLFLSERGGDISMIQTNQNNVLRGTLTKVSF